MYKNIDLALQNLVKLSLRSISTGNINIVRLNIFTREVAVVPLSLRWCLPLRLQTKKIL